MNTATHEVSRHLEDVHAIELALVQTLTAHISMTPEGEYRSLLERHLQETNAQSQRIRERLAELGATRSPVDVVRGAVEALVGQLLSAAKAPVDMVRGGPSGEEKLVRNARDEVMTEALEIAAYDVLESVAEAAGDDRTRTLAREHRTQEEVMLRQLREVIPVLARQAYAAAVHGEASFDVSKTGAAQAGKGAAEAVGGRVRSAADSARARAGDAAEAARGAAGDAAGAAKGAAGDAAETAKGAAGDARKTAEGAADEVRSRAQDAAAGDDDTAGAGDGPPVEGYEKMGVQDALRAIDGLGNEQLGRIEAYERTNRNRKTVLDRIARRRREAAGV